MSGPDRIWAWEVNYPICKDHGSKRWFPWKPKPMTLEMREGFFLRKKVEIPQVFTEYIRRDPAVIAALPEVQAIVAAAVEAEREACARMVDCGCDAAKKSAVLRSANGMERYRACGEYACRADDAAAIRKRG